MNKRRFKMSHRDPLGRTRIAIMTLVLAILALPIPLYAQAADPVDVVMALNEAANAGDLEAQIALFAEDAVYTLIPPPPGVSGPLVGKEAIRARRQGLASLNAEGGIEILEVSGDTITALSTYADDELRSLGIDFIEGVEEYTVQDGKITTYTWTATDESLAKLMAAMPPPEALPETGGQTLPTYTWVIVWGGIAILGGLSLAIPRRRSPQ
jgi:hypothetical protein